MSNSVAHTARRGPAWRGTLIWLAVIAVSGLLCWKLEGPRAVEQSLRSFADQMQLLAPRMAAALLISGFIQVLVPSQLVSRWLGVGAGIKGVFVATMVGALTPGGPMLAFPLVVVLRNSGASIVSLITFLTAWATLGFHRILMWEMPLMGPQFALVRYLSSLPLPLLAGLVALLCS
ncbi:MAG: permease, partial [Gammaproteobacteria bacterium]|nr:permease [Gammaproteobacteria bacterium]